MRTELSTIKTTTVETSHIVTHPSAIPIQSQTDTNNKINFDSNTDLIEYIGSAVDNEFIDASIKNGSFSTSQEAKDNLKIVFTSLHGTSIKLIPEALKSLY